jgi:hypothetical protein
MDNTILNEYFSNEVARTLYANNDFLSKFKPASEWLQYKTVHLPFSTNDIAVVKNQTTFDTTMRGLAETKTTFLLDAYRSETLHVEDFEQSIVSYNKFDTCVANMYDSISSFVANSILRTLAEDARSASKIILTTGSAGLLNSLNSGGNKKKLVYADFLALKKEMDKSNIKGNRYLLLDAELFSEVLADTQLSSYLTSGYQSATVEGTYPKIAGITLLERSKVVGLKLDNSAVVIDGVDTLANTDSRVAIGFIDSVIYMANTQPITYINSGVAYAHGTILSAGIYAGAKNVRMGATTDANKTGVWLVKQG